MAILLWWLLLAVVGATTAPYLPRLFPSLPDRGISFARPIAVVLLTLLAWLLGSIGLPYGIALVAAAILLVAAGTIATWRFGAPTIPRSEIVRAEALFGAAFLFFVFVRALRPEIFGAEKYMDFAFFNACLRTAEIPPEDPWLAGSPINYYYFGYLAFATLARLSSIEPAIAYNLSLATIGAVLVAGAASIGRGLTGSTGLGILGGAAAAVFGNLDGAHQMWIERRGFGSLDYWRSSRVVPNTINEFPFFSLLHGDLHPHVAVLLVEVTLVAVLLFGSVGVATTALATALLAAVALTNPWDLPFALALLGLATLRRTWRPESPWQSLLPAATACAMALAGIAVLALPFARHFEPPLGGIGLVHAHTTMAEAFVVFGILGSPAILAIGVRLLDLLPRSSETRGLLLAALVFTIAATTVAGRSALLAVTILLVGGALAMTFRDRARAADGAALIALAGVAVGACEVVFLRDPYGEDLHRMNTVFKFYFQAWLYGALAFPAMVALAAERLDGPTRRMVGAAALALLVAAGLCYPAAALVTFGRSAPRPFGIDGLAYLGREHPDDAAAIRWLRDHVEGRPRVLEATGDAYSYFARVSSNTGLPTLLGWGNHEGVWRGHDPRIAERSTLVKSIYEEPSSAVALDLLRRHGVRFVFVGELERKTYSANGLAKFSGDAAAFRSVATFGTTAIYEIAATDASR